MELNNEIKKLVIARLEILSPETGLSFCPGGSFTRDELIEHVKQGDEIGKKIEEIQMAGLRYWKEAAGL